MNQLPNSCQPEESSGTQSAVRSHRSLTRRQVLKEGGYGIGLLTCAASACKGDESAGKANRPALRDGVGLPKGWRSMRKIDVHNHVFDAVDQSGANWARVESMIEAAEWLGIETLCCSRPITGGTMAEIAEVRRANDAVLATMQRYPERVRGFCFIQPGNGHLAIEEIKRCFDRGMIGVKLYNQFKYSDPIVYPIAEKCIDLRIPLLGHSAHLTDARSLAAQPMTSDSLEFCKLSTRFPELILILGHVNGGGDWEWAIKGLRECENVYLDTSGSVLENDTIEMCVRALGVSRILFATDQTMEGCVGKILSAQLTSEQREDIFWKNAHAIFARRTS